MVYSRSSSLISSFTLSVASSSSSSSISTFLNVIPRSWKVLNVCKLVSYPSKHFKEQWAMINCKSLSYYKDGSVHVCLATSLHWGLKDDYYNLGLMINPLFFHFIQILVLISHYISYKSLLLSHYISNRASQSRTNPPKKESFTDLIYISSKKPRG